MTDQSAQEPTMEEILASIRRIISEDDAPADTAATPAATAPEAEPEAPAAPEPEAPVVAAAATEPEPVAETPAEDDVLELTDRYEAPAESVGDIDVVDPAEAPFPAAPHPTSEIDEPVAAAPSPTPAPTPDYDALVGESAAASAASAFAGLHASFKKPEAEAAPSRSMDLNFASGSTVEAMVAEMLRPMLKDWLDANLPGIVEAQVRKEVERIARSA
jgi:cell pole-organizing protein PopZ